MTRTERLKRLRALEERLNVRPKPRAYVRESNTGQWWHGGPPGGVPRPDDTVISITWVRPNGTYGGEPVPAVELIAAREARRP